MLSKEKIQNGRIEKAVSALIFIGLMPLFGYLYYYQLKGSFPSDLSAHLAGALSGEGYSLLSRLYFVLYHAVDDIWLIAVMLAVVSASQPLIIAYILKNGIGKRECTIPWYVLLFCGVCLTFVCEIYIPVLAPYFYKFSSVTQPWHNQTYIFMKICSLITVVVYEKMEKNYLNSIKFADWILFVILLTITNAFKPNFVLFFAPMMLIPNYS